MNYSNFFRNLFLYHYGRSQKQFCNAYCYYPLKIKLQTESHTKSVLNQSGLSLYLHFKYRTGHERTMCGNNYSVI